MHSEDCHYCITDNVNQLFWYINGLENDRQTKNQGVHDCLREIQNEFHDLANYIHEKEVHLPLNALLLPPPPATSYRIDTISIMLLIFSCAVVLRHGRDVHPTWVKSLYRDTRCEGSGFKY